MASILRHVSRAACRSSFRPLSTPARAPLSAIRVNATSTQHNRLFSATTRQLASEHEDETFEEFTVRVENDFNAVNDVFELQRNLNNAFAYDLVPAPSVITAALRAARRVNDFPTAVRIFEGLKHKVENQSQYEEYLKELEPIREELGISLQEHMYPNMS